MFPYDVRLRRFQQLLEGLLFGTLIIASVTMILRESLKDDVSVLPGVCRDEDRLEIDNGIMSLTQRLFEFYFRLRYKESFVFSPTSFYAVSECPEKLSTFL